MKKFYSFVLMAMMLLVGTNAWADDPVEDNMTASELRTLFNNVAYGLDEPTTITLTKDVVFNVSSDEPIWVGTAGIEDDAQSIILDLNGYNIKTTGTTSSNFFMFILTHGELLVRNSDMSKTSEIQMTATCDKNSAAFIVTGSYKSNGWNADGDELTEAGRYNTRSENVDYFSHLELGERVKIVSNKPGIGIQLDEVANSLTATTFFKNHLKYQTSFFGGTGGFSYGVRVDVYGDISVTASDKKSYAIKANGMIASSLNTEYTLDAMINSWNNMTSDEYQAYLTYYDSYADQKEQHKKDTIDAPFVHVHKTSHLKSAHDMQESAAIYAAGYVKWLIEGHCEGALGLSIKSGAIEIHDATIESTSQNYTEPQPGTGSSGTGSAIVLNSVTGYAGNMQVTVSGDSKVTAVAGNAIEEVVNTYAQPNPDYVSPEQTPDVDPTIQVTKLQNVTILGGSFEGGENPDTHQPQPAIVSASKTEAEVVAYGGTFNNMTQGDIETLAPNTEDYHATPVEVDGKTVLVISEGAALENDQKIAGWSDLVTYAATKLADENDTVDVKWTAAGNEDVTTKIVLGELQLISGTAGENNGQVLNIKDGATLDVKHLMMNDYACIIVEAGGKLIVEGTQGIIAPNVGSIKLQNEENKPAIFLFNPAVTSNKWPNASVVVNTVCKQTGAEPWTYIYQRIASPLKDTLTAAPANDFGTDMTKLYTHATNTEFESYLFHWDMAQEKWVTGSWAQMAPFTGYQLANNSQAGDVKYTFAGRLVGNQNGDYRFAGEGFDFFGNSYTAPIYIKNIFDHFNNVGVQAAVWIYDYEAGNYIAITPDDFDGGHFPIWLHGNNLPLKEIAPFAGFIMKLDNDEKGNVAKLDYASAIWGNPDVNPSAAAPARYSQETADRVTLRVDAANGKADMIKLVQSDRFSEAFDNGADASKYFSENGVNLYAVTNDGELARVATNDLENTVLAFQAGNATEYTISVPAQSGETFMLRDLVTNQTMMMEAGATYAFNQEAYSTNNARFEIVAAAKMPTAIDNTEVKANVKGIYTITGQYVGENFEILPAGVYVVNGVKIVK